MNMDEDKAKAFAILLAVGVVGFIIYEVYEGASGAFSFLKDAFNKTTGAIGDAVGAVGNAAESVVTAPINAQGAALAPAYSTAQDLENSPDLSSQVAGGLIVGQAAGG
jgi:hypothetical protein